MSGLVFAVIVLAPFVAFALALAWGLALAAGRPAPTSDKDRNLYE